MTKKEFPQLEGKIISAAKLAINRERNMEPDFFELEFSDGSYFVLEVETMQPKFSYMTTTSPDEDVPPGIPIERSRE